jgi:hypothetical protein
MLFNTGKLMILPSAGSVDRSGGLKSVTVCALNIPTIFQNFDDYRSPFLGRTSAAPTYLAVTHDKPIEL